MLIVSAKNNGPNEWEEIPMRLNECVLIALLSCVPVAALTNQTFEVTGIEKPAEIIVDKWGVPHIYAQSQYDAFFAQGFNAARDRLWQIDLWLRQIGRASCRERV